MKAQWGDFIQFFEVIRGDQTSTTSVEIEVLPTAQIELAGPLDGRILMQPGSTSSTVLTVTNTGTGNGFFGGFSFRATGFSPSGNQPHIAVADRW